MKNLKYFFFCTIISSIISCVNDDNFDNSPEIEVDQPENIITTPCNFDISSITENTTIIIDCLWDLNGSNITLPKNVNFDFNGGDIINGTLDFSGGTIDGRLLNYKLNIQGDVTLKDSTFRFYAVRWDIKEGNTTSEIALQNTEKFENVLFLTHQLGATTFQVDKFDAFFEVTKVTSTTSNQNFYPSLEAINIPSNFHLIMTGNTHLRIFPGDTHNRIGGAIFAVRDASNITVSGGNLHGDRDQRVFSPDDNGLEGSYLFIIHSGKNIIIDGLNFEDGSAGTFAIHSFGFSFNPDYNPTMNVTIKNCVIKNSRRMAIALTDGRDIVIEGNTFINVGQPSVNTDGGEVGYAINIEPDRFRDDNGVLMERQKVFDVLIKGNTERGSRGGFLTLTIGQDITVTENNIGTRVVYSFVSGVKITKNIFKALDHAVDSWAIFAAGTGVTVFNNEIAHNIIEGYSLGIATGSIDAYIHDNSIANCGSGIQLNKATKARIYDNTITVSKNGIQGTNTYSNTIEIKGNTITSGSFHVYFVHMNASEDHDQYNILFDSNSFLGTRRVTFSNTNGITFTRNEIIGGMEIGNAKNIDVSLNNIKPNESDGIRLFGTHNNTNITNNTISEPTGADQYLCINNDTITPNGILLVENKCN